MLKYNRSPVTAGRHAFRECVGEGDDRVTLLDGTDISVRRLDINDVDAVIELHRRLTDGERYFRFFSVRPAFLTTFAHEVVEHGPTRWALGAFDSGRLIGVANYVATSAPGFAEVAVAVAHKDHLRGVATALLRQLGKVARKNGIRYFTADVLAENAAMLRVLLDAGWEHEAHFEGQVLGIRVDLGNVSDHDGNLSPAVECLDGGLQCQEDTVYSDLAEQPGGSQ
jgi:RimJ/RimL family protein N-acetyltransferase